MRFPFPGLDLDSNLHFFFLSGLLLVAETSWKHNTDIHPLTFQVDIVSYFLNFFYIQQLWSNIIFQVMSQIVCGSVISLKTSFQATTRGLQN